MSTRTTTLARTTVHSIVTAPDSALRKAAARPRDTDTEPASAIRFTRHSIQHFVHFDQFSTALAACGGAARIAAAALALAASAATPAAGQATGAAGSVLRSVAPPAPGQKNLLSNLHLAPAGAAGAAWFWEGPGATPQLRPGRRLGPILAAQTARLERAARARADRSVARRLMAAHGAVFARAARDSNLSLPLLLAAAIAESGGDPRAVRRLGFQPASTMPDALEMAGDVVGPSPTITHLHVPGVLVADVT